MVPVEEEEVKQAEDAEVVFIPFLHRNLNAIPQVVHGGTILQILVLNLVTLH
jgi:hypothetical protein